MNIKIKGDGPVILVDDQASVLHITRIVFEKSEIENELLTFSSGEEFLEYMNGTKDGNHLIPEVVLLDLNMPSMSGFEVLQTLRADAQFRDIPLIIVLTASDDPKDKERAIELGANGFQTKFLELKQFIDFANSMQV